MTESWPALLRALVAGKHLTGGAAGWAMEQIVRGDASPVQVAAFLTALGAKGATADELDGCVDALLRAATPVSIAGPAVDLVGTGGDGKNAVNVSTMASIVVAATGATVVKHGGRSASATSAGSADVVEALGIPLDLDPDAHVGVAAEAGITFLFAPQVHPGMRHAGPIRRELGIPTVFNALGPLINPASPAHRLIGVADARLLPIITEVLRRRGVTALVARGDDGLDKLSTATTSQVWIIRDGQARHEVVDPRTLGIPRPAEGALRGGDAAANARVVHDLLAGRPGPVRDVVLLNAAAALAAVTATPGPFAEQLRPAWARCAEVIDSGAAAGTLARWVEVSAGHRHVASR
ncbi:anthranilate phosphoribosyltransferase [Micromonospora sediminicola]|uniref:Anthranilate phosphoribosyltransferase n=1 Tax=Micromonospora sediminicola TaxID=946078 RepID=A0A1A9B9H7_9ACTN|nr:anthranilate phosphoribosyltransferase [Micromonospora sediminicola]SBT65726.1 anthranilate phosphoribosyltransferase [Micromonospora sediminicola]